MRKFILISMSIVLSLLIMSSMVFAVSDEVTKEADALYELGLFKGTGIKQDGSPEYSLYKTMSRSEAVTMLVRLIGKEDEALSSDLTHPFTDVPAWADKYVAYAYNNGLTNGVSAVSFGAKEDTSCEMYTTFVLRALGYSDQDGDFSWDDPYTLADMVGLKASLSENNVFRRANAVDMSCRALLADMKNQDTTLGSKLSDEGVFTKEQYTAYQSSIEGISDDDADVSVYLSDPEIIDKYATKGLGFYNPGYVAGALAISYQHDDEVYSVNFRNDNDGEWYNVFEAICVGGWLNSPSPEYFNLIPCGTYSAAKVYFRDLDLTYYYDLKLVVNQKKEAPNNASVSFRLKEDNDRIYYVPTLSNNAKDKYYRIEFSLDKENILRSIYANCNYFSSECYLDNCYYRLYEISDINLSKDKKTLSYSISNPSDWKACE